MDHMISALINGIERPLNYSVELMFKVNEKFGGVNQALDALEDDTRECVQNVLWFAVELANDGELCRRQMGLEPRAMLRHGDLTLRMKPIDFALLKHNVIKAITEGYRQEVDTDEEIDLGLAELNEKKAPAGA